MANDVVQLKSGILVEVEKIPNKKVTAVAGKNGIPEAVVDSAGQIQNILETVCTPIGAAWKSLGDHVKFDKVEVDLTLSFEASGDIFISKAKGSASLSIKLTLTHP